MGAVKAVLITVPDMQVADSVASCLVERRLAACVNAIPGVVSTYRWKGAVERDSEVLLVAKTTDESLNALIEAVLSVHPYEVPEVISLPVGAGNPRYLNWVLESVGGTDD